MEICFTEEVVIDSPVRVIAAIKTEDGPALTGDLSESIRAAAERALSAEKVTGRFDGDLGQSLEILTPPIDSMRRLLIVGMGRIGDLGAIEAQSLGGHIAARVARSGETIADIDVPLPEGVASTPAEWAANLAVGAKLRNYRYTIWRSETRAKEPSILDKITIHTPESAAAELAFSRPSVVADGVALARDMTNDPPNSLYPETFAERARELESLGVEVEVLDEAKMEELGMNAILAVGQGSDRGPRLLILRWHGEGAAEQPDLAFIGKGITFDSGGLNLKGGQHMLGMKGDMAAGAAVVGWIQSLAAQRAPVHVVGVVPLAENSINGRAYRPSDIIRTARGDTIEVVDTDGEGRLVLTDGLWYVNTVLKPKAIVSMGTLGGSGLFGLGLRYAGLYTESEALAEQLIRAGQVADEPQWRLPAEADLDEDLEDSDVADTLQSVDFFKMGADSGYIARLLRKSVGDTPWAHIEMCRLEWAIKDRSLCPKGATGYGVRLLEAYVNNLRPIERADDRHQLSIKRG